MENSVLDAPSPTHNHRRRRASFTQQPGVAPLQTPTTSRPRHQHSRSQQLPSTSPAYNNFLFGHHHSLSLGTSSGSTSPLTEPTTPLISPRFFEDSAALSIEFDGNPHQLVVRPNSTVRGRVILQMLERLYLTRIRIKFWAEEVATVKINDNVSGERVHQAITTFFETDHALFGVETTAHPYMQASFEELDAGRHEFPFSLKFPNVNYPPSIDDPPGFSIRFIWTAHVDGAAGQPGFSSKRYITPYRPLIGSPPGMRSNMSSITSVDSIGNMAKLIYALDKEYKQNLESNPTVQITAVCYKFQKHHLGRLSTSQGLATRKATRDLYQSSIEPHQSTVVSFNVPTRNVSPTFQSNHIRIYYELLFQVTLEEWHFLKNTVSRHEFGIPIHISNLAHDEIRQIPGLLMIQHYTDSKTCPEFLDVSAELADEDQPPSYYSAACNGKQERQEKTVYFVRSPTSFGGYSQSGMSCYDYSMPELGEAHIIPGVFE